ncbi:MAG: M20/M25/M40 family metallo-hydrolase [Bryobacteraceae bacterium]|nr:M20/M25/M40 family metallo-hydrolase [Bryobacteraceae bacterium]
MVILALFTAALSAQMGPKQIHPAVQQLVEGISPARIEASMRTLVSFETRGNFTETTHPTRGIGAARRWIHDQFRSYSSRLDVRYDSRKVGRQGRIFRDLEVVNVVAELKGTRHPERQIVICAHYDSLNLGQRESAGRPPQISGSTAIDAATEKLAMSAAPGASDNASGVAAVLEMARVLSQHEFDKTLVFVAFAGEELGLVGSSLHAQRAKRDGQTIEAVLNSDIIGTEQGGDGRHDNRRVRVFSADPADSVSRQLARYVKEIGERYVPELEANLIFRADRFSRAGDHTSFESEGFAAVRFTSAVENYAHQHSPTDTMEHASPSYAAKVTRMKTAVAASLALAPKPPALTAQPGRGRSSYEAALRWEYPGAGDDVAGFAILIRRTTSPLWEREIHIGRRMDYTIPGLDIDDWVFGIKAIGKEGHESLVAAWVAAAPAVRTYYTVE